jgi:hypothetical protein
MLRDLIRGHADTLPKEKQAKFTIGAWSKLKAHFGTGYRLIPAYQFSEALSIVSRHIADYTETAPSNQHGRWLISYDEGKEHIQQVPNDACVMTSKQFIAALFEPNSLYITTDELADIAEKATTALAQRAKFYQQRASRIN